MKPISCSGCGAANPQVFFEVPRVPVNVGSIASSREEAQSAACGSIRLAACEDCGLIANQLFDYKLVGFKPGYEVSLKYSEVFRKYIQGVCDRLVDRYNLRGKDILEIGCGAGDFLRMICSAGANRGVGIDPTAPSATVESAGDGTVRFIQDYYSTEYKRYIGDFVCCLSVFEDIPRPLTFLQELRQSISDRDIPLYFEVFNGYRSIRQQEVWSIHYEQCNYYSLESLVGVFQRAGFAILDAGVCYQGDQYLFVEARPSGNQAATPAGMDAAVAPPELSEAIRVFGNEYRERCRMWQNRLQQLQHAGKTVVVWGSGGKGISFLSALNNANYVDYVVDINPNRQGHYIPATGHAIFGPAQLVKCRPDVVILTNALYQIEITAQLHELGIQCEMLVA